VALNDGYAVDAQGRRIYFPPIGQPRVVPSTLDEAKLNGAVFTYGGIAFGLTFVGYQITTAFLEESAGYIIILALPLIVHYLAASLRARRWPALNNPNYTYHRFVVSTLRRQSAAWLRFKLIVSAAVALALVALAVSMAVQLQSEWAMVESGKNLDRLVLIPMVLAVVLFCTLHAYRIHVALRRQRERRVRDRRNEPLH
jgi:hypothetical protein